MSSEGGSAVEDRWPFPVGVFGHYTLLCPWGCGEVRIAQVVSSCVKGTQHD